MFISKEKCDLSKFLKYLDKSKYFEDILELDLLPNSPQSAIDEFKKYKEIMKIEKETNPEPTDSEILEN